MASGVCACGCGVPVKHQGLEPRFANLDGSCQQRWLAALDHGEPLPELTPEEPVTAEERIAVRLELAQRWTEVRPRPRSLWKAATSLVRKVV